MNTYNKKNKIPGIFVVFVLIVLGGFSALTYAIAEKIPSPDLGFAKIDLSNLKDVFGNEIIVNNDTTGKETTPEETPILITTPEPTPTPTATKKPPVVPTPIHTATPTPSATPQPSPLVSEDVAKLKICQNTLTYRIRFIDGEFYQNNLDRNELVKIALYAESQWESATNTDLFKYDDSNINANTIDFTHNTSVTYDDEEAGQFGITETSDTDKNGLIDEFRMTIFREIFYLINRDNAIFIGELNKNYNIQESVVTRAVLHQMGHLLGIEHLPDGQLEIMSKNWIPTLYKPALSESDKVQVKELCK